jgi:hypothetical protein
METVIEFLYHALGLCGEHWHPNVLNLSVIGLVTWSVVKGVRSAVSAARARYARFEGTIKR